MASRRAITAQRAALVSDLRRACRDGRLRPGEMLPTTRALQEKYGLSPRTVTVALQELVAEGLLRTEPRVGVFVAGLPRGEGGLYLIVGPSSGTPSTRRGLDAERLRMGFEERMTKLGGSSLLLDVGTARQHLARGNLPPPAGLFAVSSDPLIDIDLGLDQALPRARVSPYPIRRRSGRPIVDTVHMDNVDGGRQAARHLWQHGHRAIAFLGLQPPNDESDLYHWSTLRERGWRDAMNQARAPVDDMVFSPATAPPRYEDEVAAAHSAAEPIVRRRDITAVVCANDNAAMGLLAAMRAAGIPSRSWPSIVSFDGSPEVQASVLTSMRLPWEDIGKAGAQLLWDRARGGYTGGPRHVEEPMMLVSRIGLQKDWSSHVEADALIRIVNCP